MQIQDKKKTTKQHSSRKKKRSSLFVFAAFNTAMYTYKHTHTSQSIMFFFVSLLHIRRVC